jgi:hypothetical protein
VPPTDEDTYYSNERLHKWNIIVWKKLGLVICRHCQVGVVSSQVPSHIMQHGYSGVNEEEIQKAISDCPIPMCSGLKDDKVKEMFKDLHKIYEPITYLDVYDGFQCIQCGYSCGSKSSIRSHYSSQHKNFNGEQKSHKVKVQSLFYNTVTQFKYFRVKGNITPIILTK